MTHAVAVLTALSLILFDITLVFDATTLKDGHVASSLVYLFGVAIILKELCLVPGYLRASLGRLRILFEIPICMLAMEYSLQLFWKAIQEFVIQHSAQVFTQLTRSAQVNDLVCRVCCDKHRCSEMVAEVLLKMLSFGFVLGVVTLK